MILNKTYMVNGKQIHSTQGVFVRFIVEEANNKTYKYIILDIGTNPDYPSPLKIRVSDNMDLAYDFGLLPTGITISVLIHIQVINGTRPNGTEFTILNYVAQSIELPKIVEHDNNQEFTEKQIITADIIRFYQRITEIHRMRNRDDFSELFDDNDLRNIYNITETLNSIYAQVNSVKNMWQGGYDEPDSDDLPF